MANVVEHKKFVFVSNNLNSNKVWEVLLYDNDDVEVRYGRIGKNLQSKVHSGAGRSKMESLVRDKTRPSDHYDGGCYKEIEVLDAAAVSPSAAPKTAAKSELKKIATTQIATCPITQKLIAFFTDVNAHNIYQATGGRITYDVSAGTFRTPIGIVTRSNVDAARDLLDKITDYIQQSSFGAPFVRTLEDYLMLIPQDVGRKFEPRSFCGDVTAVQRQSTILDGLEASIAAVLSAGNKKVKTEDNVVEQPKLFTTRLFVEQDSKTLKEIQDFYDKGKQRQHVSYRLKMKNVYVVDMPVMKDAWDKDGKKMQNVWKLWHGSKSSNFLSLLKNGFVVPPASASYCVGRSFGNGTYFSSSSTKSLNYATNYWGGRDEGRYFMLYNMVAMGRYFVPTNTFSGGCPRGYDSTYCEAGRVFQNPEMVVYRVSQILPTHLIEFG